MGEKKEGEDKKVEVKESAFTFKKRELNKIKIKVSKKHQEVIAPPGE